MRSILLDLIRVIAISMIVFVHIAQTLKSPLGDFFGIPGLYHVSIGGLGVTILLALSGLVLELSDRATKKSSYFLFILKRVLRIYPIYYMSVIVGIGTYFLFQSSNLNSVLKELNLTDLLLTITGLYAFVGKWGGTFSPASWFIGLIMSMYFLYPFLSSKMRKFPVTTISILFTVSLLTRLILYKYELDWGRPIDWFPACRVFEFSFGIFIACQIPKGFWQIENYHLSNVQTHFLVYLSEITFPLFLIHSIFRSFLDWMLESKGLSVPFSIFIYLSASILTSCVLLEIDRNVPRKLIFQKLEKIRLS
jgi:peptidoglycan/LPS O-acetylase OafA/YrhL